MMVGNACGIALPYIGDDGYIHRPKKLQKVLFVATEMQRDEIQTLVLSWVSGINERKFLLNEPLNNDEQQRVAAALDIIDKYQDNLVIEVITDPCVSKLKRMLTTYILERKIEYIVYDYIFTSPSLMAEFPSLREDVSLMMLSNMLKEVAATYNVFILSGSQLNGDWSKTLVRTANCLRGAKSLADKIDVGMIGVPVLPEELEQVAEVVKTNPIQPNIVIDIYKNRRGEMCYCKVFRRFDHGTCRTTDLFATTQEFQPLSFGVLKREEEREHI
jgi:replicative DNA helicase